MALTEQGEPITIRHAATNHLHQQRSGVESIPTS
jgi:hypothetical protein